MPTTDLPSPWIESESGFASFDGTRLYYRHWQPRRPDPQRPARAYVFLHRGHEHSGRIGSVWAPLGFESDMAFAWDARGHGHSPGERGFAPDFATLVRDFDAFIAHLCEEHGLTPAQIFIVANSVGAVIAATWLHDYAVPVRGVVMVAAAFRIKLYVPLAQPALRLGLRLQPDLAVTSYIRPGMLTHSAEQADGYARDPLITRNISARVLLDLSDTAERIVADAQAIATPVLMLVAGQDHVVETAPQQRFYDALPSPLKRWQRHERARHALLYESAEIVDAALQSLREFAQACFAAPLPDPTAAVLPAPARPMPAPPWPRRLSYAVQRAMLGRLGRASLGMRIGLQRGFDSGESLDHVYRNQATGTGPIGRLLDRGYLDAIGWRGIRLRKRQLQELLDELLQRCAAEAPGRTIRLLDAAAGPGRYVLEAAKRHGELPLQLTLCDQLPHNLEAGRTLAQSLGVASRVDFVQHDAFDDPLPPHWAGAHDIAIVSGLYELFSDNARIARSLAKLAASLRPGGWLLYTGQPWHPQLEMIAHTLTNHRGEPWVMRPRPQAEMDALVAAAGLVKVATRIGLAGIFTVSAARKPAPG